MKRIRATCGIGFVGAYYEEIFEFDDDTTLDEIEDKLYEWAQQFLDISWEDESEEDEDE